MTYYHVRITLKSNPSRTETQLDLSQDMLEERFIRRYERGLPIVIAGRTVPSDDIGRIHISESEEDSSTLNEELRRRYIRRRVSMPVDHRDRLASVILASMGEDVTIKFIGTPPGGDVQVASNSSKSSGAPADARDVFVVYGRNTTARDALFEFLRAIDLHPIEWAEAVSATGKASPYIGEILGAAFSLAQAVVVLLTPDEDARLRQQFWAESEFQYETLAGGQARPNVLFEAGIAMGRNEGRTVLVELGSLRPFSDIAGRHVIRLDNSTQRRQELAQRLRQAGCPVNMEGSAWHSTGDFEAALVHTNKSEISGAARTPSYGDTVAISGDAANLLIEAMSSKLHVIQRLCTPSGTVIKTNGRNFGGLEDIRSGTTWDTALKELVDSGLLVEDDTSEGEVFGVTPDGFNLIDSFEFTQDLVQEEMERSYAGPKANQSRLLHELLGRELVHRIISIRNVWQLVITCIPDKFNELNHAETLPRPSGTAWVRGKI